MLPLINLRKANNSILGRCYPLLKIMIFLFGLICLLIIPLRLNLESLIPLSIFILFLFILAGAWRNRKIYACMLFPFLSFFLVFSILIIIIYLFKCGFTHLSYFYLVKFNQLRLIFIKGFFIVSLTYVFVITTNQRELLYVLKKLKVPPFITSQLILIVRSLQLLIDEFRLLPLALRSRGLVKILGKRKIKSLIYAVFYRTLEKGKSFEYALHSRAFNGEFFTLYSPEE